MPYVNIKVTRDHGVTRAQKRALIGEITKLLQSILGKDPELTFVVIDEVDAEDWGIGGVTAATLQRPSTPRNSAAAGD